MSIISHNQIYPNPLRLGLGPWQVSAKVRIAEERVMQALCFVKISKNTKFIFSETEGLLAGHESHLRIVFYIGIRVRF